MKVITLLGQVPAQKNEKRIAINTRTGKPFPMTSPAVKAWQEEVGWQLKNAPKFPGRVEIAFNFYCKDNRRRDLDNMISSVQDSLVRAGVIKDDSWQVLTIVGATGAYDKDRPRVEIFIDEVE